MKKSFILKGIYFFIKVMVLIVINLPLEGKCQKLLNQIYFKTPSISSPVIHFTKDKNIVGTYNDQVFTYNINKGELYVNFKTDYEISNSIPLLNNLFILIENGGDDFIDIWSVSQKKVIKRYENRRIMSVSSRGKYILLNDFWNNKYELINIAYSFSPIQIINFTPNTINGSINLSEFYSESKIYFINFFDNQISYFDLQNNKIIPVHHNQTKNNLIHDIVISSNEEFLLFSNMSYATEFKFMELESGKIYKKYSIKDASSLDYFGKIAISPDNNFIAQSYWANNGSRKYHINLWNLKTGNIIKSIELKEASSIGNVIFSMDGELLACPYRDKNGVWAVNIWQINDLLIELKSYTKSYKSLEKLFNNSIDDYYLKLSSKNEFETSDEFKNRIDDFFMGLDSLYNNFIQSVSNLVQNNETIENENYKIELQNIENQINESLIDTIIKLDKISDYNADNETFNITINGVTKKVNIKREEARSFKENWKSSYAKGKRKLKYDLKNYDYFDLIIIHPLTKSEYKFD